MIKRDKQLPPISADLNIYYGIEKKEREYEFPLRVEFLSLP
jgi:hypothetical protein